MANVKTEQVLSILKKAYCSGVYGNIDLCDTICIEILNDFIKSVISVTEDKKEIDIDLSSKNSWTTVSMAGDYQNFINFDAWTNVIVPNGTTI